MYCNRVVVQVKKKMQTNKFYMPVIHVERNRVRFLPCVKREKESKEELRKQSWEHIENFSVLC